MDGTEHLTYMGERRNLHKVLAQKPKQKTKIGISMGKSTKVCNGFIE
jgi:hypothetical protein